MRKTVDISFYGRRRYKRALWMLSQTLSFQNHIRRYHRDTFQLVCFSPEDASKVDEKWELFSPQLENTCYHGKYGTEPILRPYSAGLPTVIHVIIKW